MGQINAYQAVIAAPSTRMLTGLCCAFLYPRNTHCQRTRAIMVITFHEICCDCFNPTRRVITKTAGACEPHWSGLCSALTSACQMSRAPAMKSSGFISFEGLEKTTTYFTGNGLYECLVTRPIIQEMRTNSCTKLRPLMEEAWTLPAMPCVKEAHHSTRASLCSSVSVSPLAPRIRMNGLHSSLGPSLLCLLPPPAFAWRTELLQFLPWCLLHLQCLPLHGGASSQPTNMLRSIHIQDDIFPFLLQMHPFFCFQVFQMNISWILITHWIFNYFNAGCPLLTTLLKCFLEGDRSKHIFATTPSASVLPSGNHAQFS